MMTDREVADRTRAVYHQQHLNYSDPVIFRRFMSMVNHAYFGVADDFFVGKSVLDAGCGNTAYFEVAMHLYGAQHVTCIDIGDEWIAALQAELRKHNIPDTFTTMRTGSTAAIPFPDNSFDFVASNGVLQHLSNVAEAEQAFAELARVTKPGGHLYIILGVPGGLVNAHLLPAVRDFYQANAEFREFIDELKPEHIRALLTFVSSEMKRHTGEQFDVNAVAPLFDLDWTTFIQNCTQAPRHMDNDLTLEWALEQFRKNGFSEPRRCRRYVKRENVRKFAAPLHYNLDHTVSRLLYGDGCLEYIAQRAS